MRGHVTEIKVHSYFSVFSELQLSSPKYFVFCQSRKNLLQLFSSGRQVHGRVVIALVKKKCCLVGNGDFVVHKRCDNSRGVRINEKVHTIAGGKSRSTFHIKTVRIATGICIILFSSSVHFVDKCKRSIILLFEVTLYLIVYF